MPAGSQRKNIEQAQRQLQDPFFWLVVFLLLAALCAIYLPSLGHGFVKDDFVWIGRSRIESFSDVGRLAGAPTGFFRPLVSLSFAANLAMCGLGPLCYGLTNFLLLVGCAAGVVALAIAIGLPAGAALLAGAIWAFNWHGINMAVLWISGRTALLLVLFATWSAAAFLRQRWIAAVMLCFAAMLSKEEAIALPVIFVAWALFDKPAVGVRQLSWPATLLIAAAGAVAEGLYGLLRWQSGAFTASTAPTYYQLSFTFGRLGANLLQYLDRSATFAAVVLLVFAIVSWFRARSPSEVLLESDGADRLRAVALFGLLWWIGGFALTIFLPVRSSLYACFPSVGIALAGAAVAGEGWRRLDVRRRSSVLAAGIALPFCLWPLYHARNGRMAAEAELSARTLSMIQLQTQTHGPNVVVLLKDDRAARPSLDDSFGALLQSAVDLVVSPDVVAAIDPPPTEAPTHTLAGRPDVILALKNGQLVEDR